jgi:chromate transporter
MRGVGDTLVALAVVFAPLSLLSFGGGNAVIADIAQQAINVQGWTSEREFADLFALSRAAPGPGSMLAALIGWKAAGVSGALVATVAFYLPSAVLVLGRAVVGPLARFGVAYRGRARHGAGRSRAVPVGRDRSLAGVTRRAGRLGRGDCDNARTASLAQIASRAAIARRRGAVWSAWRVVAVST